MEHCVKYNWQKQMYYSRFTNFAKKKSCGIDFTEELILKQSGMAGLSLGTMI
jgi:hypothetical protein